MEIELASVEEAKPEQLAGSVIGEALPGRSFGSDSEQAAVTTIGCERGMPAGAAARGARAGGTVWSAAAGARAKNIGPDAARRKRRGTPAPPPWEMRRF